jgi:O-antigen ligase
MSKSNVRAQTSASGFEFLLLGMLAVSLHFDLAIPVCGRLTFYQNEILLAILAILTLVMLWKSGRAAELTPWILAFLPLTLWIGAHIPDYGAWESARALLRFGQFFLALSLVPLLLTTRQALERGLRIVFAAGCAACLWGLAQTAFPHSLFLNDGHLNNIVFHFMPGRAGMSHHNQWSAYLVAWLLLASACLARGFQRRWAIAALMLGAPALLFSYSRGAWLGILFGAAFLEPTLPRSMRKILLWSVGILGTAAVIIVALGPQRGEGTAIALVNRCATLFKAENRSALYPHLLQELRSHGSWGLGDKGFRQRLETLAQNLPICAEERQALSAHAHNLYLQISLTWGWPALLGWFLALSPLTWAAYQARKTPGEKIWALAIFAALAAFLLQSFTDVLLLHARGAAIALCWGFLIAFLNYEHKNGPPAA